MLDWIKQALGVSESFASRVPNGRRIVELIAKDVDRFRRHDVQLPQKATAYVCENIGGDVPALLRKSLPNHSLVWGADQEGPARQNRWQLYEHWDAVPADVWIRFGSVLAADSGPLARSPSLVIAQRFPWVEALALDFVGLPVAHYGPMPANLTPFAGARIAKLEALLEFVGEPRAAFVAAVFQSPAKPSHWNRSAEFVAVIPGFQDAVVREADRVRGAFRDKAHENRGYALRLIMSFDAAGLEPFAEELVALSMDSSGQVRAAAVPLALRAGTPALSIAEREAVAQKPEQRARALQLLWASGLDSARAFVRERGSADSAESVKNAVQTLLAMENAPAPAEVAEISVPELKVDLDAPLSEAAREALREAFRANNRELDQIREKTKHEWQKNWVSTPAAAIERIVEQTANHPGSGRVKAFEVRMAHHAKLANAIAKWARREDVTLAHVVRLMLAIQWLQVAEETRDHHRQMGWHAATVFTHLGRVPGRVTLLALDDLMQKYGVAADVIGASWFGWGVQLGNGWPAEAIWPWFARHRQHIDDALNPAIAQKREYGYLRYRVYEALATFPAPPPDLVPFLFDLALGTNKQERAGAQRALESYSGKVATLIEALSSGKADTRTFAAAWLARLHATEAIGALEAAVVKEKHDGAAGALMSALEALDVPIERFLDRGGLPKKAQAGLKKGIPSDLEWFPLDTLPALEWADTGDRVPTDVARWWIVQSCRLKTAEPGGVLRHYFAALRPATREAFAVHVLQAWIKEDTRPIPTQDAEKMARTQAQQIRQSIQSYPQHYADHAKAMSEQQYYETYLPIYLNQPAGSAIGSKGVLAVVAAGGGSEIASLAQRYLKAYYGTRAAQGKALIQMLAWVDHPTATQLMLSIGSRFRTKSFQEEATLQAQLLAERRGWTVDELSDRTIPSAGFDSDGTTEIDYGTRKFSARLTADLEVELFSPEGKPISSLPDARKDEDEAHVKEVKKQWTAAKKELKGVLQLQKDRLYEALCTERTWKLEDWQLYLNQHPVVRRYCQRLVWSVVGADGRRKTFRPLEDGSLTDLEDNAVTLEPAARIALAHNSNVSDDEAKAWVAHLGDYKIDPLFQQFGKGIYRLPEDRKDAVELEDFAGHLLEAFALRGRATKLGYTRGAAGDGGWFMRYEKRFPTLGIEANVEFTGNTLPEENRTVALRALSFTKRIPGEQTASQLALGEVPRVLLSECWNDMRIMAAEGSGFDPDWQKKTEY